MKNLKKILTTTILNNKIFELLVKVEKMLLYFLIVYYVPMQPSRCLYEDAEFNLFTFGSDDKTVSKFQQFDCVGTYDTLFEKEKRKRDLSAEERKSNCV